MNLEKKNKQKLLKEEAIDAPPHPHIYRQHQVLQDHLVLTVFNLFISFFSIHLPMRLLFSGPPSRAKSMTVKLTSIFGFKLFLSQFFFLSNESMGCVLGLWDAMRTGWTAARGWSPAALLKRKGPVEGS